MLKTNSSAKTIEPILNNMHILYLSFNYEIYLRIMIIFIYQYYFGYK
jgi:hypothetical protein